MPARGCRRGAGPRADLSQRSGRLLDRWTRVRRHDHAGADDADAVGQCSGESGVWLTGLGKRQRRHLERERAGLSSHALVERPGVGPQHRSVLRPRRDQWTLLVGHLAAQRRRDALRDTPRLWLQRLRTLRARDRDRVDAGRRHRRAGQVRDAEVGQSLGSRAFTQRHRLPRMGARRRSDEDRHAREHDRRREQWHSVRHQSVHDGFRRANRLLRCRRGGRRRHERLLRSSRVHRA